MATNFPTSLDSLTNPLSTDTLNSPSHADQHANVNDAVEALEAKVGVNSSAVTTSHDYKITRLENSRTVSDSPPSSPVAGDLWYESDTGRMFVYYDSFWVEYGADAGRSADDPLSSFLLMGA